MRPVLLRNSPADLKAYIAAMAEKKNQERRQKILDEGYRSDEFKPCLFSLDNLLAAMEAALQNQAFLAGDACTLADAAIAPFIERLDELTFTDMSDAAPPRPSSRR